MSWGPWRAAPDWPALSWISCNSPLPAPSDRPFRLDSRFLVASCRKGCQNRPTICENFDNMPAVC